MSEDGPAVRSLAVYALDVGQGDATFILPPDGAPPVLFDCADDRVALRFVDAWTLGKLSAVVVSHLDWDHVGGLVAFLKQFDGEVGSIFLSDDRLVSDAEPHSDGAKALIDYVIDGREQGRWKLFSTAVAASPVASGHDWSVRLLAPEQMAVLSLARAGAQNPKNLLSAVLRVELNGHAMLIGGDAPLRTWVSIPPEDLASMAFRVPHHGGALDDGGTPHEWGVDQLYAAVGPRVAVVSVGTRNGHDHPHPHWIAPIAGGGRCRLLCTQVTPRCEPTVQGLAARFAGSALRSNHFAEPPWRHLSDRRNPRREPREVPCAGTVVTELRADGTLRVLPEPHSAHERLVDGWKRPLCRPVLEE